MGQQGHQSASVTQFITQDEQMQGLLSLIEKVAPSDVPVLIQGESGTGKEVLAKRIHELSHRSSRRMVSINCGAIQDNLLLSELFGHEKGAFTGALFQKQGLVEVADGGTLFLDEIGEMGLEAQAKLLRFLQEGEVYRVGGKTPMRVDVRVLSATNRDLESAVKNGNFREDLYYRINTVSLRVSPLRKRPADVPLLIQRFLESAHPECTLKDISPKAMELLKQYRWPGNVRELQNMVERFKILVESDSVQIEDLPPSIQNSTEEEQLEEKPTTLLLMEIEKSHILRCLKHFKGNKTQAANAMGITVKTLYNKLAKYDAEKSV